MMNCDAEDTLSTTCSYWLQSSYLSTIAEYGQKELEGSYGRYTLNDSL